MTNGTYDTANQTTSLVSTSYSYDRNGNLVAYGANTLAYDAANVWTSGTVNGQSVTFGYDGFGRRSSRTVGTARTDYWYDETGLTLETGPETQTYLRDPEGVLLSKLQASLYNYGRDRLGSTTALVTSSGSVARTYSYDPWGQRIGTTGTTYNPFQFTGTYFDGATGLYQMGARYYQPTSGRFTQLDPLPKNLLTFDRYAYAACNPANFVDPTGLDPCNAAETGLTGSSIITAASIVSVGVAIVAIATGGLGGILLASAFSVGTGIQQLGAVETYVDACGTNPY